MPSSHLILCRPLLLLPPIPPSIRVFSNESTRRMRWPKYWSFSFSISTSKEIPGLISFRMDWLDLPAVQGTLKSLLEHHSSKASILWRSAFFTVQLSHPYMTTGKTIALTRRTFVDHFICYQIFGHIVVHSTSFYPFTVLESSSNALSLIPDICNLHHFSFSGAGWVEPYQLLLIFSNKHFDLFIFVCFPLLTFVDPSSSFYNLFSLLALGSICSSYCSFLRWMFRKSTVNFSLFF